MFRAVLVDECQDLGTVELDLVRALATDGPDALFLVGDPQQQVFPKDHSFRVAGIVPRQRYLRHNYRNPRQILQAGARLVGMFGNGPAEAGDGDTLVLDPEYSARESPVPLVVSCADADTELRFISRYIKMWREIDDRPVAIVACGIREDQEDTLDEYLSRLNATGVAAEPLSGAKTSEGPAVALGPRVLFVSGLESVKGFEFSLVIVAQCSAALMPRPDLPAEESWRDARRLYVAMTRARDEVIFTHAGDPSPFLSGIRDSLRWSTAEEQFPESPVSGSLARSSAFEELTVNGGPVGPSTEPPSAQLARVVPSGFPTARPVLRPGTKRVAQRSDRVVLAIRELLPAIEIVDKRHRGGSLWLVGGRDLEPVLTRNASALGRFAFAPRGSRSTGYRPAWYLR